MDFLRLHSSELFFLYNSGAFCSCIWLPVCNESELKFYCTNFPYTLNISLEVLEISIEHLRHSAERGLPLVLCCGIHAFQFSFNHLLCIANYKNMSIYIISYA